MVMPYEQYVQQAREEGFWVCSVWDPSLQSPDYLRRVERQSDAFVCTDFGDREAFQHLLRRVARNCGARWIYHIGREDSMVATYEVAEELGLAPNPTQAVRLLNDKLATRAVLQSAGLSLVRHAGADSVDAVRALLADFGLPAIVKPTSLSGSRGVYLLCEPDDVDRWVALVDSYRCPGPFLVEEQLTGPEFSVESLSADGRHTIVGITAKAVTAPPLFVETGHVHPAPLPADQRRAIEALVRRLLDLCGYRFGPAHTEVILTVDGPRVVESQARLGGDRIHRLVELSTGLDLERAVFRTLAGAPLPAHVSHRRIVRIGYLNFPPGLVTSVTGIDRAAQSPGVDEVVLPFAVGDRVPVTLDSKSRHGHVIVAGGSAAETEELFRRAAAMLTVRTEPAPDPAEQFAEAAA